MFYHFYHFLFVLAINIGLSGILVANENNEECQLMYFTYQPPKPSSTDVQVNINTELSINFKWEHQNLPPGNCSSAIICYQSFLNADNPFARPQFKVKNEWRNNTAYFFCKVQQEEKKSPFKWNWINIEVCNMDCGAENCALNISMQHPFEDESVFLGKFSVNKDDTKPIFTIQFWSKESLFTSIKFSNKAIYSDKPNDNPPLYNGNKLMGKAKGFWSIGFDLFESIAKISIGADKMPLILAQPTISNDTKKLPLVPIGIQIENIWPIDGFLKYECKEIMQTPPPPVSRPGPVSNTPPVPKPTPVIVPEANTTPKPKPCPTEIKAGTNYCDLLENIDDYVKCGLVTEKLVNLLEKICKLEDFDEYTKIIEEEESEGLAEKAAESVEQIKRVLKDKPEDLDEFLDSKDIPGSNLNKGKGWVDQMPDELLPKKLREIKEEAKDWAQKAKDDPENTVVDCRKNLLLGEKVKICNNDNPKEIELSDECKFENIKFVHQADREMPKLEFKKIFQNDGYPKIKVECKLLNGTGNAALLITKPSGATIILNDIKHPGPYILRTVYCTPVVWKIYKGDHDFVEVKEITCAVITTRI